MARALLQIFAYPRSSGSPSACIPDLTLCAQSASGAGAGLGKHVLLRSKETFRWHFL
jgi:hypothetical protein